MTTRKEVEAFSRRWLASNQKRPDQVQFIDLPLGAAVMLLEAWEERETSRQAARSATVDPVPE